jgi:hypothetical protein
MKLQPTYYYVDNLDPRKCLVAGSRMVPSSRAAIVCGPVHTTADPLWAFFGQYEGPDYLGFLR